MASAWGTSWGTAWADSWGATGGAPAVVTPTPSKRRKAMYPGGWIPEKLHTPPRKKLKKRALAQLKRLYEEARETIPEPLQAELLPDWVFRGRVSANLPPPARVDFEALARSLETIKVLIAAVEAQRERIKKRRRDEETLLTLLAEIL